MSLEALREKLEFAEKNPAIFNQRNVLDKGFVRLVDWMGDDSRVVQAARVSYGKGTKTIREDAGLIDYLMRHRHCYHPEMEVLTTEGWKRWSDCGEAENFLVPDPETKQLRIEKLLPVKSWEVEEELYTFSNNRMSYKVTKGHKMWFKQKGHSEFTKVPVEEMSPWGHFEPLVGYTLSYNGADVNWQSVEPDARAEFSGFFMGDGSFSSMNTITFHLKKKRKVDYLLDVLNRAGVDGCSITETQFGTTKISLPTPDFLNDYVIIPAYRRDSDLRDKPLQPGFLSRKNLRNDVIRGLWLGLVNSDGSIKADRPQIQYSSWSDEFLKLFETLGTIMGYDVHDASDNNKTAYYGTRTSLESRSQYHGKEGYKGKVYCATTSTGLLAVRGGSDKFGFVCGNTSPFEMVDFTFHIKLPLFVFAQLVRHRTASLNAMSARYSVMKDEFYIPGEFRTQGFDNKQGSEGVLTDEAAKTADTITRSMCNTAYAEYEYLMEMGVSREQARMVLPQNLYTEVYWKQNLHNLLHLLRLRLDAHAQQEIREYAEAIHEIIAPIVPASLSSWEHHVLDGVTITKAEIQVLGEMLAGTSMDEALSHVPNMSPGYTREVKAKLKQIIGV